MPYQCLMMLGKKESHPLPFPCDNCIEIPWSHVNKRNWTLYNILCLCQEDPLWIDAPKYQRFWIEAEYGEKVREMAEKISFPDREMPDKWYETWSVGDG